MQDLQQPLIRSIDLQKKLARQIALIEAKDTDEADLFDRIEQSQQQRREISPGMILISAETYNRLIQDRKVSDPWASGLLLVGSTMCLFLSVFSILRSPSQQLTDQNTLLIEQQQAQSLRSLRLAESALKQAPKCRGFCW